MNFQQGIKYASRKKMKSIIFLNIGSQLAYSERKCKIFYKNKSYIEDCLSDYEWQKSISEHFITVSNGVYNIFISLYFRFFDKRASDLKSYAKFKTKEERLIMDMVFFIENYEVYDEDDMRIKLCEDILSFVDGSLKKYNKRFLNFDSEKFLPFFVERIENIKNKSIPFYHNYDAIAEKIYDI